MNRSSLLYLLVTAGLFVLFAVIVLRTYSGKRKEKMEAPKHRMMDDD